MVAVILRGPVGSKLMEDFSGSQQPHCGRKFHRFGLNQLLLTYSQLSTGSGSVPLPSSCVQPLLGYGKGNLRHLRSASLGFAELIVLKISKGFLFGFASFPATAAT